MRCAAHRKAEENKDLKEGRTTHNINCLPNITLWLKYRVCTVSLPFKWSYLVHIINLVLPGSIMPRALSLTLRGYSSSDNNDRSGKVSVKMHEHKRNPTAWISAENTGSCLWSRGSDELTSQLLHNAAIYSETILLDTAQGPVPSECMAVQCIGI